MSAARASSAEREWQAQSKGRSLANAAFGANRAAVQLDDLTRAGQSDTTTGDLLLDVGAAVEPLEDEGQIAGRDTLALILDTHHRAVIEPDVNSDRATTWAVLDGVVQQVAQHALEAHRVPRAHHLRLARLDPHDVALGGLLVLEDDPLGQRDQIDRLAVQLNRSARLQTARIDELVQLARHAAGAVLDLFQRIQQRLRLRNRLRAAAAQGRQALDERERRLQVVRHGCHELV